MLLPIPITRPAVAPADLWIIAIMAERCGRSDVRRTADRMRIEHEDDPAGPKANHQRAG